MCGRFVQYSLFPEIVREFDIQQVDAEPRPSYNIAPTQDVAAVINDGVNRLITCRWGLIPPWSRDPSIGSRMINARAETVAEKPSFKKPFRYNRCLIVADGFYEWRKEGNRKIPVYVRLADGRPFGLAGLYSDWNPPDGDTVRTCTIITTEPNSLLEPIHNRMPVIIPKDKNRLWLDPDVHDPIMLEDLLLPYGSDKMKAYNVSTKVNSPANDSPENIEPVIGDQ
jgi:putative SOS response-associated peptidase YedK